MDVLFAGTSSHIGKWWLEDIVKRTSEREAESICFLQTGFFCACVLMGVCNNVSTPYRVTRWVIKGEKLIWGQRQGRYSDMSKLEIEMAVTFLWVNFLALRFKSYAQIWFVLEREDCKTTKMSIWSHFISYKYMLVSTAFSNSALLCFVHTIDLTSVTEQHGSIRKCSLAHLRKCSSMPKNGFTSLHSRSRKRQHRTVENFTAWPLAPSCAMWEAIRAFYLDHSAVETFLLQHQLSLMSLFAITYNICSAPKGGWMNRSTVNTLYLVLKLQGCFRYGTCHNIVDVVVCPV